MRCDEVVRELAQPADAWDEAAMADHLAGCPSCAERARGFARLDQLWDATRPPEPAPEAWESVWANVARSLQGSIVDREPPAIAPRPSRNGTSAKVLTHRAPVSSPVPARPSKPQRARRFAAIALLGLAQAAAVLIAIGLAWHAGPGSPIHDNGPIARNDTPAPRAASSAVRVGLPVRVSSPVTIEADIEEGRLVMIRAEGPTPQVVDVTPPEMAYREGDGVPGDAMYFMFNMIESISNPVVASR